MPAVTPLCDFCQAELQLGSTWNFPARDHRISLSGRILSEGGWSACRKCRDLIVAGERDRLAKRGARAVLDVAPPGTTLPQAIEATRRVQDVFWANREGEPRLETAKEWAEGVQPWRSEWIPPEET